MSLLFIVLHIKCIARPSLFVFCHNSKVYGCSSDVHDRTHCPSPRRVTSYQTLSPPWSASRVTCGRCSLVHRLVGIPSSSPSGDSTDRSQIVPLTAALVSGPLIRSDGRRVTRGGVDRCGGAGRPPSPHSARPRAAAERRLGPRPAGAIRPHPRARYNLHTNNSRNNGAPQMCRVPARRCLSSAEAAAG